MSGLLALADRCEAAAGPDREMDASIFAALNPTLFPHKTKPHFFVNSEKLRDTEYQSRNTFAVPRFTASIDAALTLVPEGMRDEIEITTLYQIARVTINMNHGPDGGPFYGSNVCNSISLAICAAALRARAASTDAHTPDPSNERESGQ